MRSLILILALGFGLPAFASTQFKCEKDLGEPGVIVEMEITHNEGDNSAKAKLISGAWTKMAVGLYTVVNAGIYQYHLHMQNDNTIAVGIQLTATKDGNFTATLGITDKADAKFTCVALN